MKCIICFHEIKDNIVKPCNCINGFYHKECILKWIKTKKKYKNVCEICLYPYENISKEFHYKKSNIILILMNLTFITINILLWKSYINQYHLNDNFNILCLTGICIISVFFTIFNFLFFLISILYLSSSDLYYIDYKILQFYKNSTNLNINNDV